MARGPRRRGLVRAILAGGLVALLATPGAAQPGDPVGVDACRLFRGGLEAFVATRSLPVLRRELSAAATRAAGSADAGLRTSGVDITRARSTGELRDAIRRFGEACGVRTPASSGGPAETGAGAAGAPESSARSTAATAGERSPGTASPGSPDPGSPAPPATPGASPSGTTASAPDGAATPASRAAAPPAAPPPRAHGQPPPPRTASTPIPASEAHRLLRRVLERLDETAARCESRPYGAGWATVCE
jgi:hypothetical protein